MLGIAHGESNEEVSAFRDQSGYSFPMASDPDGKIFHLFAHDGIPRNYVVGKDGTILYQSVGYKAEEFDKMKKVIEVEMKMVRKASERDTR
jgi:peroxiredoxin